VVHPAVGLLVAGLLVAGGDGEAAAGDSTACVRAVACSVARSAGRVWSVAAGGHFTCSMHRSHLGSHPWSLLADLELLLKGGFPLSESLILLLCGGTCEGCMRIR
jgi:hypothetical protein